jgi:hypothetical protein
LDSRDLEASLLSQAAAKLQAVLEAWDQKPPSDLSDAYCTISLMTAPKQEHLANLIQINRAITAEDAGSLSSGRDEFRDG